MRVLLAWELGGQFGHFGTLLPIAGTLTAEGHEVVFSLKDLSHAHSLIGLRYRYLQAPLRTNASYMPRRYESFADILLHAGFDNTDALSGLVSAWRTLYAQLQPDWVIYDHAPVALFAARGMNFKKTYVGTGFSIPPGSEAFPRFRHWQPDTETDNAHRQNSHHLAMANANLAAQRLGMPELEYLPELFEEAEQKLTTFPQLDHYPSRAAGKYVGPIGALGEGKTFEKKDDERWIFCYLWARHRGSLALLKALAHMPDFKTLAVVPDLPGHITTQRYKNLSITRQPIDLINLSSWAELIVCHAGHGTLALASSQGIPSVNSPITLEQTMLAQSVEVANAGITLSRGATPNDAARQIADAVSQQTGKAGARLIQSMHQASVLKSQDALLAALL